MRLNIGDIAPDFELPDQNGGLHKLSSYLGSWVLLYFYPKDNTPGCTVEACTLRDSYDLFKDANITILGVSSDSPASHMKFREAHALPFTLLADESREVIRSYDSEKYMRIVRNSFLIDPTGKIAKVYENVAPADHANEVLSDVKSFETDK